MPVDRKYVRGLVVKSLFDAGYKTEVPFVDEVTEFIVRNSVSDGVWRRPLGKHMKELKEYWEKAAEMAADEPESRDILLRAYDCLYRHIVEEAKSGG